MTTLSQIAQEASKLLNDSDNCDSEYNFTRWSRSELVEYAKDAILMIAMLYPKKFNKPVEITLSPGTVQCLPDSCIKLTKLLGVVDESGTISSIVSSGDDRLGSLFSEVCAESVDPSNYKIESYSYEESADNIFYVQPPVPNGSEPVVVSALCASPPDLSKEDSKYEPAGWMHNLIIEWILYRAYSSEDESSSSSNNAKMHLEHFYTIMGNYVNAQERLMSTGNTNAAS